MNNLRDVLGALENIDKAKASDSDVLALFRNLKKLGLHGFEVPKHGRVLRCRTCAPDFPAWRAEKDISYYTNSEHGRASLPGSAIFYGCAVSKKEEFEEARMLSIHETNKIIWDPAFAYDEEYAVVGNWTIQHPMNVLAVVQAGRLHGKNDQLRREYEQYLASLDAGDVDKEGSVAFMNFMAEEFIKEVDRSSPHEYRITAAFSHHVMKLGLDGVAYPSARAQGDTNSYNIALKSSSVDDNCKLGAVYSYRLMTASNRTLVPYPFLADTSVQGTFHWRDPGYLPRLSMIKEQIERDHLKRVNSLNPGQP